MEIAWEGGRKGAVRQSWKPGVSINIQLQLVQDGARTGGNEGVRGPFLLSLLMSALSLPQLLAQCQIRDLQVGMVAQAGPQPPHFPLRIPAMLCRRLGH